MVNLNWFLAAPLLLGAFAGCLGFGGGAVEGSADTEEENTGVDASGGFGNASAGVGAGGSSNNVTSQWTYDNRSGSMSGNALVVTGPEPKLESFTVVNGTQTLTINLSADGDGLVLTLRPPGCDNEDCEVDAGSADAQAPASFDAREPEEGDWKAVLRIEGGPGPVASEYDLEIGQEQVKKVAGSTSASTTTTGR